MRKEILRLMTKLIELRVQCGYDISELLEKWKKIPYRDYSIPLLKESINWLIEEYNLDTEKEEPRKPFSKPSS